MLLSRPNQIGAILIERPRAQAAFPSSPDDFLIDIGGFFPEGAATKLQNPLSVNEIER
jgi:hypothetical protein